MSDRELRRSYAAYRETQGPSPVEEVQTWEKITERLSRGDTGPSLQGGPVQHDTARRVRRVWIGMVVAAGLVMTLLLGRGQRFDVDPRREHRADHDAANFTTRLERPIEHARIETGASRPRVDPAMSAPVPTVKPVDPVSTPSTERSEHPSTHERSAERKTNRRSPSTNRSDVIEPQPTVLSAPASIRLEVKLLEAAKHELAIGQPDRALALLHQHSREFPHGVMGPECDVLEIRALCAMGEERLAEQIAGARLRARPGSPWASDLRRGCHKGDPP